MSTQNGTSTHAIKSTGKGAQNFRTPRRDRPAARIRRYSVSLLVWLFAVLFLLPFVWMLSSSLKANMDVFSIPVQWIPHSWKWENYVDAWTGPNSMLRFFSNSLLVTSTGVIGDLVTSAMAGYAFGRLQFRGRDKVFMLYLATLTVPGQLLIIPRFMMFQQVGLYDTLWAVILPGLFTVFGVFLLRQFFAATPAELGEAARMDGANEWQVFWRVYLPLARPVLAALAIISFVATWNDFEGPLIMLSSIQNFTIPLGLSLFVDADGGMSAGLAMAASVSAILPVFVVFLIFQRKFIESLAHTGLK